ncbi:serine/threonine-protein kinase [Haliangium sp.]|uniref:serine/threonine-protein kinase n=1 Tax=Haliangium sp. TaxID=2663208 RepID=UPI003D13E0F7
MIGEVVGNYRITANLSKGGMGAVYVAEHTLIGRKAAVKVLLPAVSERPEVVKRFFTEAKATAAIGHPGIVEIFDFGHLPNGDAYLVMELLDGVPLSRRLSEPMDEGRALALMGHMTSALAAAHGKGIVHRDLKPGNVMIVPDPGVRFGERTKLLDFGIAKLTDVELGPGNTTRTGAVMGTPAYMSPEQCRGAGHVDHRTDLYALGCILFHMLCARPPFLGFGAGEIIGMQQYVPPPPPRSINPAVTPEVEELILCLLVKDPDGRPANAEELQSWLTALSKTAEDEDDERRPSRPLSPPPPSTIGAGAAPAVDTVAPTALTPPPGDIAPAESASPRTAATQGAATAAAPSTLSAGSHVTVEPEQPLTPAGRWPRWSIAAAGALALAVGVGVWAGTRSSEPRVLVPIEPDAGAAVGAAAEVADAAAAIEAVRALIDAGADASVQVLITIASRPRGAQVYLDGERIGRTPLERFPVARGDQPLVFELRKRGYQDGRLEVLPDGDDEFAVELTRRRSGGRAGANRPQGQPSSTPVDPDDTVNPF